MRHQKTQVMLMSAILICLLGCGKNEKDKSMENPRTEIATLQKWFPNLMGIESAEWEAVVLGSDTEAVPGPGAYRARGIITLNEETAEVYMSQYQWEECELELESDYVDLSKYQDTTWYYCRDMEKETKPDYYLGNFYFNGKEIWFDVTK